MEWFSEESEHELHELRCLHELARQLLPLGEKQEVARDGLLCIAGITGVGAGAVFWRQQQEPLVHLSQFGLREPATAALDAALLNENVLGSLVTGGPTTLESLRRRTTGRPVAQALEVLGDDLPQCLVLPMAQEAQLRGLLLLGPSLVTGDLLPNAPWLADLADTLKLALIGSEERPSNQRQPDLQASHDEDTPASQQLATLRSRYPATRDLVGESDAILAVLQEVVTLAETDYTVMVHGGTGTGKEMAASLLHRLSRRSGGPFEAVDCSSIPQELIESELFGHVKGAFTGAMRDFKGAFERADGGTLLLDEIGDMDLRSQTRLLRVLQEGKVRPLGGDRPVSVDVRVVAATNRDLAEMVRAGTFREDLYYRIHVCLLSIPALKDRAGDRVVLFEHFMRVHAEEIGRAPRPLHEAARQRLLREEFPGNVRQLQNVVRQLLVQGSTEGEVGEDELDKVLQRSTLPQNGSEPAAAPNRGAAPTRAESGRDAANLATDANVPAATGAATGVHDVGDWVVAQLREHRFNLSAAAKMLSGQRTSGSNREAVPVFDRGALDYYLCGEYYERLLQSGFDSDAAVLDLAGDASLAPKLRRKVRVFVRPLESLDAQDLDVDSTVQRRFPRLPERYHPTLRAVVEAVNQGRWDPTTVSQG